MHYLTMAILAKLIFWIWLSLSIYWAGQRVRMRESGTVTMDNLASVGDKPLQFLQDTLENQSDIISFPWDIANLPLLLPSPVVQESSVEVTKRIPRLTWAISKKEEPGRIKVFVEKFVKQIIDECVKVQKHLMALKRELEKLHTPFFDFLKEILQRELEKILKVKDAVANTPLFHFWKAAEEKDFDKSEESHAPTTQEIREIQTTVNHLVNYLEFYIQEIPNEDQNSP